MNQDRAETIKSNLMQLKAKYPMVPGINEDMAVLIRVVMILADEVTKND